jgi:superfamily I DNA/RNA helicase
MRGFIPIALITSAISIAIVQGKTKTATEIKTLAEIPTKSANDVTATKTLYENVQQPIATEALAVPDRKTSNEFESEVGSDDDVVEDEWSEGDQEELNFEEYFRNVGEADFEVNEFDTDYPASKLTDFVDLRNPEGEEIFGKLHDGLEDAENKQDGTLNDSADLLNPDKYKGTIAEEEKDGDYDLFS